MFCVAQPEEGTKKVPDGPLVLTDKVHFTLIGTMTTVLVSLAVTVVLVPNSLIPCALAVTTFTSLSQRSILVTMQLKPEPGCPAGAREVGNGQDAAGRMLGPGVLRSVTVRLFRVTSPRLVTVT